MHLLVIRFSAMGDVALTVPALRGIIEANPQIHLTLVTNASFEPMFYGIDRLNVHGIDLQHYSGLKGLRKLYNELNELENWDGIIDLHSVMRSWVISGFFRLDGKKVYRINKGRSEKAELVSKGHTDIKPLKHTTQRYLEVFSSAGIKEGKVMSGAVLNPDPEATDRLKRFFEANGLKKQGKWIGLAPFSMHRQKTWPLDKVKDLIAGLVKDKTTQIFLLGSSGEASALKELAEPHKNNCRTIAGLFSLDEEIALMYELDMMIAMDSFNMHLAALCGIKVVSIWGGTHRYAGFGPLNDNEKYIVEIDPAELPCRPCSVFGSKPCYRKDWACLERIPIEDVLAKVQL